MRLTTEDLPEIDPVTASDIERVLGSEAFGNFVILYASDDAFIQATCMWEPGPGSKRFVEETGSDPFRLEYRDGDSGRLFAAEGRLTLDRVQQALLAYLVGEESWRSWFAWAEVDY
ncbi:MAG TPA: hypothetical protein VM533_18375 [Fimbriiglobus sp.]|nr:hypothetical protein [Fimbriiglobus sp.]